MKSLLSCPICSGNLSIENRTYKCENKHCFDMAKEGYVNLLISNKSADSHGDDKEMVASRTRFLDGGWYNPLKNLLCNIVKNDNTDAPVLLDAGCGEGYYTSALEDVVTKKCGRIVGIDLSKSAVRHTAKRCVSGEFAVASVYNLPIPDSSCDIIVNCFSPMAPDEFSRVLKKSGLLLYVVPGPKHLWELKNVLYDTPYENEEKLEEYENFRLESVEYAETSFTLTNKDDILSLFHMTPYTWKTPREGIERLKSISALNTTAQFRVHVFRKQ